MIDKKRRRELERELNDLKKEIEDTRNLIKALEIKFQGLNRKKNQVEMLLSKGE